jgi:hypothetical protein
MLKAVWTLLLPAYLLAISPSLAQDREDTAKDLVRKSGLWEQLGAIGPQVRAGIVQAMSTARSRPSATETDRLTKAVESSYEAARLRAAAAHIVATGISEGYVEELRRWYSSSAGIATTQLEEAASARTTDLREVAAQGVAILAQSTVERRALLGDLVRETKAAESAVEMTLHIALAVQRGASAATPDAPSVTAAELMAALEPQRLRLLEAYTKLIASSFALTYKSLPDADLERYITFIKSPAGEHFHALAIRALVTALSEASEEFGQALARTKDRANS